MSTRDLTKAQFAAKVKQHGMKFSLMGYVEVTDRCTVYRFNAGENRRAQLAYLLRRRDEYQAEEMQRAMP